MRQRISSAWHSAWYTASTQWVEISSLFLMVHIAFLFANAQGRGTDFLAFLQPQREALTDGLLGPALLLPGCSCISGLWTEPPRAERWHCVCGLMPLASQGSVDAGSLGPGQSPIMKGAYTHTHTSEVREPAAPARPSPRRAGIVLPSHCSHSTREVTQGGAAQGRLCGCGPCACLQ